MQEELQVELTNNSLINSPKFKLTKEIIKKDFDESSYITESDE